VGAERRSLVKIVGIAFDLRKDFEGLDLGKVPDDRLEEYDSEETVQAIAVALTSLGYVPRLLGGGRGFIEKVLREPPDLVFNIAEGFGTRSREAHVPAVCEMLRIPCTHSDPLTAALTLDKGLAKQVVVAAGVATPKSVTVTSSVFDASALSFPVIAKPSFEGSSMGVRRRSRVTQPSDLRAVVEEMLGDYRQPVLIEEFQTGPELTVGILGNGDRARVIASMEITPTHGNPSEFVYGIEAKRNYKVEVAYHVPPRLPPAEIARAESLALAAYRALGCRDVGRVDVRFGGDGAPRFIEVNPLPGLNPVTGDLCILSGRIGMEYPALIGAIVDEARRRTAP